VPMPPSPRPRTAPPPRPSPPAQPAPAPAPAEELARTGWTIQVGAFANVENAVRLTQNLQAQNIEAYYFLYRTGLYKVRFGDFPNRERAEREAERVKGLGIIDEYYLVSPDSYSVADRPAKGDAYLRDRLVETARSYLGVPYQWGGASREDGFDCSGLTMAVYQLNGLNLPHSSAGQYQVGRSVKRGNLQPGDLVFFATGGGGRVSHVGVYCGGGDFIHAPGSGQRIRTDSLSTRYFADRFVGARTYF
jgi:cell wall-associated NlpC family hydrolase